MARVEITKVGSGWPLPIMLRFGAPAVELSPQAPLIKYSCPGATRYSPQAIAVGCAKRHLHRREVSTLAQGLYFLQMRQEHLPPRFLFRIAQRTAEGG